LTLRPLLLPLARFFRFFLFFSLLTSACARPAPTAPRGAAPRPSRAPREVPVIRYTNRELRFPNVFEPSGEHVGVVEGDSCAIWQRDGHFLGDAPVQACAGWLPPGVRATSPDGRFELMKGDGGNVRIRESAAKRVVWQSGAGDDCDARHFAWSLAEHGFVVRCGDVLVARALPDGHLIGWTQLPTYHAFTEVVWGDQVHAIIEDKDEGPVLFSWVPGHAETSVERQGVVVFTAALDPVTGAVWKFTGVCGHSCSEGMEVLGGVGTPTSYNTYHFAYEDESSTAVIAHDGASAFVVDDVSAAHDGIFHGLSLVRISGGFRRDGLLSDCCDSTVRAAVARGGAWVAVAVRATRFVDTDIELRVRVLDPSGKTLWEQRNTPALLAHFQNEDITEVALSEEERTLAVRSRSGEVVVPLGGLPPPADPAGGPLPEIGEAFSFDGDVLMRPDGLALSTRSPCWWPAEWEDVRGADLFRVGEDPLTARDVSAEVTGLFCAPGLLDRFARGEPMPPRPRPVIRVVD
jgi:hypothetical protein